MNSDSTTEIKQKINYSTPNNASFFMIQNNEIKTHLKTGLTKKLNAIFKKKKKQKKGV